MKISRKMLIAFMAIMLAFTSLQCVISNAAQVAPEGAGGGGGETTGSGIMGTIKTLATSESDSEAVTSVNTIAGSVISIAKVICAGIAIIMLTVIAMKYMMAAPSEKADIKKHAVVYVVGAVIMFAATGILQIIQNFATVLE